MNRYVSVTILLIVSALDITFTGSLNHSRRMGASSGTQKELING